MYTAQIPSCIAKYVKVQKTLQSCITEAVQCVSAREKVSFSYHYSGEKHSGLFVFLTNRVCQSS